MTEDQQMLLAQTHAPILWLHEREAFVPVDVSEVLRISDLYHKSQRLEPQPHHVDELGELDRRRIKSEECELRIPDLDLVDFQLDEALCRQYRACGPAAVLAHARARYGQIKDGIVEASPRFPKYYARVVPERKILRENNDLFTRIFWDRSRDRRAFGTYTLIQYFFYFVYNDGWNQHQGDWDCQVDLYLKDDRQFMITHHHTSAWASRWPEVSSKPTLKEWVDGWNALGDDEIGELFRIGNHPFVFLAQGAHGGFPTPGYTLFGLGLPGDDFLSNTDERQIGRTCLLPPEFPESLIRSEFARSGLPTDGLRMVPWKEPELVLSRDPRQPWLRYKGNWGQTTRWRGWSGPKEPPITKRAKDRRELKKVLLQGYKGGTTRESWHGI